MKKNFMKKIERIVPYKLFINPLKRLEKGGCNCEVALAEQRN